MGDAIDVSSTVSPFTRSSLFSHSRPLIAICPKHQCHWSHVGAFDAVRFMLDTLDQRDLRHSQRNDKGKGIVYID